MLAGQVALVGAVWLLAAGSLRVASSLGSRGLERVLVAVPLAAAFAVAWTLALGLVGLSGSAPWLVAGAALAWAAARLSRRQPVPGVGRELVGWLAAASRRDRVVALGLAGVAAGLIVEVAAGPAFGLDAIAYHLADVVGWIHSGHAGAVQSFSYDFPVGYYPVTNEVLLAWSLGISRSFAPLALWSTGVAAITLIAVWKLLEALRAPRRASALAVLAVATLPTLLVGINAAGPGTDLVAVMWLACAAALCACALERPALLGPALVAAGLGVGTKTTVAPLAAVAVAASAWTVRGRLMAARAWLTGGAAAGLLVGVPWYVRAAIDHGWPLWPFSSGPTGDPLPHAMRLFDVSFLSHPIATVSAESQLYLEWVAGGLALIAGTVLALATGASRATRGAAAVALAAVLAWTAAPFTGLPPGLPFGVLALSTVRYLLAALVACAVALAIAARDGGRRRVIAEAALVLATLGSIAGVAALGYPPAPNLGYPIAGAAVGVALGWPALRWRPGGSLPGAVAGVIAPSAAVLVAALLALSAPGWLHREAENPEGNQAALQFMLRQPSFADGAEPVASAPLVLATLAGPHLRHPLSLIGAREPCARVRARLRHGWIIVFPKLYAPGLSSAFDAPFCLRDDHPAFDDGIDVIYAPVPT
jgi:hypothetical protein